MKNKAFSLIEIIVSIFVITIGILGAISIFPFTAKVFDSSKSATAASRLAEEKIEEIIASGYEAALIGTSIESSLDAPFSQFSRETKIFFVNPNASMAETASDTGIKEVDITVLWHSFFGAGNKTMAIKTYLAKR